MKPPICMIIPVYDNYLCAADFHVIIKRAGTYIFVSLSVMYYPAKQLHVTCLQYVLLTNPSSNLNP